MGKPDFKDLVASAKVAMASLTHEMENALPLTNSLGVYTAYGFITRWSEEGVTYDITDGSAKLLISEPCEGLTVLDEELLRPYINRAIYLDFNAAPSLVRYMRALGIFCVVVELEEKLYFTTITRLRKSGALVLESTLCATTADDNAFVMENNVRRRKLWNAFCNITAHRKD